MADVRDENLTFLGRFTVLRGAARELWIIFGAKFLAILAYGVMNQTLSLWLSSAQRQPGRRPRPRSRS